MGGGFPTRCGNGMVNGFLFRSINEFKEEQFKEHCRAVGTCFHAGLP